MKFYAEDMDVREPKAREDHPTLKTWTLTNMRVSSHCDSGEHRMNSVSFQVREVKSHIVFLLLLFSLEIDEA
jgi:hypothetical protein